MMIDHDGIAIRIENRYLDHSRLCRRIWGLRGDGPRMEVNVLAEDRARIRLRGRSLTLANRAFQWEYDGGDGTLAEMLGHPDSERPLDRKLLQIANMQAMRAAVARAMGAANSSLPPERVMIDRVAGTLLARERGLDALRGVMLAARDLDPHEIIPDVIQIRMGVSDEANFGVSPCEVDLVANEVRPPEIRLAAAEFVRGASYLQGRLHLEGVRLPDTLADSAPGRRLGDIVATGEPLIDARTVAGVSHAGETLIVRLTDDMVEIGSITV